MASRDEPAQTTGPAPRLYLVTPRVSDPAAIKGALAAALDAGDVAAVLLRLDAADERTLINGGKALAPLVQQRGAALLVDGHPEIVVRAGADGAHLRGIDAFNAALPILKPDRIAGCGTLKTRHDAMLAGEAGADYVMFGEPDAQQYRPSFEAVVERVAWWAEVFEVPCVGYATSIDEAGRLSKAGADFVAVSDLVFADARGPGAATAEVIMFLGQAETVG